MSESNEIVKVQSGGTVAFDMTLDPISWEKIREEIAPQGEKLETNELIGQKFVIVTMKRFVSSYEGQEYAYYITGLLTKGKKLFNTVIGGTQPMEVLDAIANGGYVNPIEFFLTWHDGGKYDGYYTLD